MHTFLWSLNLLCFDDNNNDILKHFKRLAWDLIFICDAVAFE